jgi:hypothetical protein
MENVTYILYYEVDNIFTDMDGNIIYNIFDMITPNDLLLFRDDPGNNSFCMKSDRDKICEIITIPEDGYCGEVIHIDFGYGWYI